MVCMGTLSPTDHLLCYAHAVHLAVCDVLYKKTDANNNEKEKEEEEEKEEDNVINDDDTEEDHEEEVTFELKQWSMRMSNPLSYPI